MMRSCDAARVARVATAASVGGPHLPIRAGRNRSTSRGFETAAESNSSSSWNFKLVGVDLGHCFPKALQGKEKRHSLTSCELLISANATEQARSVRRLYFDVRQ